MNKAIMTLSILLISSFVAGQSHRDTIINIEEVKITGKKLLKNNGFVITEIDSAVLAENIHTSLSELLSDRTVIFIKSYGQGSLASASFRGTGASHTQILWNGISLNNPMPGQVDLSLIPVFFIDKAELNKGGSSLQSVSGALGGSIVLNSLSDFNNPFSATIIQTAGSNNTYQTLIKIGTGGSVFHSDFKFYREQSKNDFLFLNTADGTNSYQKQTNADYFKNALLNNTSFKFSKNRFLSLSSWLQYNNRNIPSIMSFDGNERNENQKDNTFRTVIKYTSYRKNIKTHIIGAFVTERIRYYLADKTETQLFVHTNSESNTKQVFAKYKIEYQKHQNLLLQSELHIEYDIADYFDEVSKIHYEADRQTTELLISTHYLFNNYISSYVLLRINYTDKKFLPLIPSAGFEFNFTNRFPLIVKTNFSRNFHNPTLNDLYWIPGGTPDLKPEQGLTSDLNFIYCPVKSNHLKTQIEITGFASYINDWIIWRPSEYRYWKAENIRNVFSRGSELSFSGTYSFNKIQTSLKTNYAYTKTTDETDKTNDDSAGGKQLIYIPEHKINSFINIKYLNYYLIFSHIYTGERYTSSSNEDIRHHLPAYNIENLSVGSTFKIKKIHFEAELKIKNLLNKSYQEILWRAMPGRQYFFSFKFNY